MNLTTEENGLISAELQDFANNVLSITGSPKAAIEQLKNLNSMAAENPTFFKKMIDKKSQDKIKKVFEQLDGKDMTELLFSLPSMLPEIQDIFK